MLPILPQMTSGYKLGFLLQIMSMVVSWHRLRVGLSDMYPTRKASFKDTLFIGMHQGEPRPVLPDRVMDCTFTWCKHPDCFPIIHVHEIYFEGLFPMFLVFMLCTGCYVKHMKSIQYFSHSWVIYIWGHKWILVLLLIFDWYKHSNTNIAGSKCILNRFWCITWRPKAICNQNVHIT